MIKNLVFDLGNVLVEFRPKDYLQRIGITGCKADILVQIIFKDNRWNEFDRGTITLDDYIMALKAENPQYSKDIDKIFGIDWTSRLFKLKENTASFLQEMSDQFGIYILSNVSEYVLNYLKTLDFFKFVISGTYSYVVNSCKPEEKIYTTFFRENDLIPEECLFMDDLSANILAAKKLGMNGIVFHDNIQEIRDFLRRSRNSQ